MGTMSRYEVHVRRKCRVQNSTTVEPMVTLFSIPANQLELEAIRIA
jgi:hypothetical protein